MESSRLKQQLTVLQLKKDLLGSVCGQDRAAALLEKVAGSVRDRDLLHNSLLQRKSKLQVSPAAACPALALGPGWRTGPPLPGRAALLSDLSSTTCCRVALGMSLRPHHLRLLVSKLGRIIVQSF